MPAGERYLLLADISGYTGFMTGVEQAHGVDFSAGIPAAYAVLGALLDTVIEGVEPEFALVKLEGDAVFAAAPAAHLDGQGDRVLEKLGTMYQAFTDSRTRAIPASDHVCTACPAVAHLDLKVVLHRGHAVRQAVGSGSDLLGPAVTVAHRLLKNTIRDRIGYRPYLFLTDAAATPLGLSAAGLAHREEYPDMGQVQGRIVELDGPLQEGVPT
jgi:class 3 adenylate cyclase